tara:strand:- start:42 stop:1205 length:1164 start_codon:yes stop_codon:yes gene_type:complete
VTAIIAADLGGAEWAGLPVLFLFAGRSMTAFVIGSAMDRFGRRSTLTFSYLCGALGGVLATTSIIYGSYIGFIVSSFLFGGTRAGIELQRFVAAEVHNPGNRARIIGLVVSAGTIGSIFGPWMFQLTSDMAKNSGYIGYAGPWLASVPMSVVAALVVFIFLRPEPKIIAQRIDEICSAATVIPEKIMRTRREIMSIPDVRLAVAAIVLGQGVMTMIMTITPLHMTNHAHGTADISLAMMAHTMGMFGLSWLVGRMTDSWGAYVSVVAGAFLLIFAGSFAINATVLPIIIVVMFSLGLGWNFCFVAGSALLTDMLNQDERARFQGFTESINAGVGGATALLGGQVFGAGGYGLVGVAGLVLTSGLIGVGALTMMKKRESCRSEELVDG